MSLHDELLDTARRLIVAATPTEADIRRSISTAYYALFHRLIDAAVADLLPNHTPAQQAVVGRVFEHARMRDVCHRVSMAARNPKQTPTPLSALVLGSPIPPELERIVEAFESLQQHRQEADYNRVPSVNPISFQSAKDAINKVETAFADWSQLETANPTIAHAFLLLLLAGEPKGR